MRKTNAKIAESIGQTKVNTMSGYWLIYSLEINPISSKDIDVKRSWKVNIKEIDGEKNLLNHSSTLGYP